MMLAKLQQKFTYLIMVLISFAYENGYLLTFGEAWRPQETADLYAKKGIGSKNSLHCRRLAVDFNLFRGEEYLTETEHYRELGEYWESLGTPEIKTCWGGRFSKGDGNHFSIEYEGRR